MPHVVNIKFDGVGLTSFTSQKEQEKEKQKRLSNFVFSFSNPFKTQRPNEFPREFQPPKKTKKKPICMISLCFMRRMNLVIISYYISYIIYYYIIKVGLKSCNCHK